MDWDMTGEMNNFWILETLRRAEKQGWLDRLNNWFWKMLGA